MNLQQLYNKSVLQYNTDPSLILLFFQIARNTLDS